MKQEQKYNICCRGFCFSKSVDVGTNFAVRSTAADADDKHKLCKNRINMPKDLH